MARKKYENFVDVKIKSIFVCPLRDYGNITSKPASKSGEILWVGMKIRDRKETVSLKVFRLYF